ncbi:ketopantoate reductase family protein [Marivita sp. S0852]|uniref:ketopantoate reductase family protein n=1 Tax=Marivita sp. S0852 TaxID=3373893 RepID=UPI003982578F
MAYKIVILGASYGSLLGTKLLMAGQDVTLVCRQATADLINAEGTDVRIKLRGEDEHRSFKSGDLPGNLDAKTPEQVNPDDYDMVALAMSEPQYCNSSITALLERIAQSGKPCLSIMNMPPLPYLKRVSALDTSKLEPSFTCPDAWKSFTPGNVTLCSPDPQAYRDPEGGANTLHVGLPTNFKAAPFESDAHNKILRDLEAGIDAVRVDGLDVPVKLRVFDSIFVPFAKWSMLLTGNYRCVLDDGVRPIKEAVHSDVALSESIYELVNDIVSKLGADPSDRVPFEKYANAANGLLKPSSAARAIDGGADRIERVDMLVSLIAQQVGVSTKELSGIVETVNNRLEANRAVDA